MLNNIFLFRGVKDLGYVKGQGRIISSFMKEGRFNWGRLGKHFRSISANYDFPAVVLAAMLQTENELDKRALAYIIRKYPTNFEFNSRLAVENFSRDHGIKTSASKVVGGECVPSI